MRPSRVVHLLDDRLVDACYPDSDRIDVDENSLEETVSRNYLNIKIDKKTKDRNIESIDVAGSSTANDYPFAE